MSKDLILEAEVFAGLWHFTCPNCRELNSLDHDPPKGKITRCAYCLVKIEVT